MNNKNNGNIAMFRLRYRMHIIEILARVYSFNASNKVYESIVASILLLLLLPLLFLLLLLVLALLLLN